MAHLHFDFGGMLANLSGSIADCPACKRAGALHLDTSNEKDIGFSCSNGCSRKHILTALGKDPESTYFVQSGVALAPQKDTRPTKQRLTWEQLMLEYFNREWNIRFNLVTQEIEIDARSSLSARVLSFDDVITILHSDLSDVYKGCTMENLQNYTMFLARENLYNPVLDLLSETKWDGIDRKPELFALMGIQDDALSMTLVSKWLLQTVALLFNNEEDPFGADGVLVLNGGQGVGKTSLFRRLALNPRWFGEGATIKDNDKDTTRRCVTRWITELGEVESTLKSDINALKAFVTSDMDNYRLPYARSDVKAARRTSLCATCNSDRYLIDSTGNRRWWSVPLSDPMDYDAIMKFDALQLWAQIYALVAPLTHTEKAACFRLTRAEQDALAARNGKFEKPIKAELECQDILEAAKDNEYLWQYMTVSQFKMQHEVLRPYTVNQIGVALSKLGYDSVNKRLPGSKAPSAVRMLPSASIVPKEIKQIQ